MAPDTQITARLSEAPVVKLHAFWLRLPLRTPYENALGTISDFDVILIRAESEVGRVGWGEACPVKGYSPESPAEAWTFAQAILPALTSSSPDEIIEQLQDPFGRYPFLVSGIVEAIEDLSDEPLLRISSATEIELAGTVNTLELAKAADYAENLVEQGYRSLKVKVGYDPVKDAERVNTIIDAVGERATLRVDANQGYDVDAAVVFAAAIKDPDAIEFFEQPVDGLDWDAMARIAARSVLPVMLDEAIYGESDILRASAISGIDAIKLKLSKASGARGLYRQFRLASDHGLRVVIGNGVASDLGCFHEALVCHHAEMPLAVEMNGFLKVDARLLDRSVTVSGPRLIVPPSAETRVTEEFDQWTYKEMAVS